MSLLGEVVAALRSGGVPHAVIGAAALSLHGVARSTFDTDILVMDRRVLNPQFWADGPAETDIDLRPGDLDDPLAGVARIRRSSERPVDLVVGRQTFMAAALARAEPGQIGDVPTRVVKQVDLVLLKLYAGGPQDAWDIQQLLSVSGDALAVEVERELEGLTADAQTLWNRIRGMR